MPKYTIEETMAVFVTWGRVVEAANAAEAYERFAEGEGERLEGYPVIGDIIDSYDIDVSIVAVSGEGK